MAKKDRLQNTVVVILLAIAALIILIPILWAVSTSLKTPDEIMRSPDKLIPKKLTLENYGVVWRATLMPKYVKNSFIIASTGAVLTTVLATFAAFSFSRYNFPGKSFVFILFLAFIMIPFLICLIGQYVILSRLKFLDSYIPLILIYSALQFPFSLWLVKNAFDQIPKELDEAATLDGSSNLSIFFSIMLPLSRSSLAGILLYNFLFMWNEFIIALTLISSSSKRTVTTGIHNFIGMYGMNYGPLIAAAIIAALPTIILILILQKQFITGLTEGALKG